VIYWCENPDVLADYQSRFKYILVDEYQDTNVAQYLWLRLLAQPKSSLTQPATQALREGGEQSPDTSSVSGAKPQGSVERPATTPSRSEGEADSVRSDQTSSEYSPTNICCVGDDDQSIYGWRGAEVENILRFDKDFKDAKVIRLERNYRSTSHILKAASHLITNNEGRLGKTLFTDLTDPDEEKLKVAAGWDSEEEARAIGEEIESLQRKKHPLNDIAMKIASCPLA